MTVLVTLRITGDVGKLEAIAEQDPTVFPSVSERAKGLGVISHHFYASGDTVLVIDEWPSEEAFHAFFEASPEIADIMQRSGVTAPPEIMFWRKLDLGDDIG